MGDTAENIAEQYGISREDQDTLACLSHMKVARALEKGVLRDEIVPIIIT